MEFLDYVKDEMLVEDAMKHASNQGETNTDNLREYVNKKLKIKNDIPKINASNFESFVSQYNTLYQAYKSDFIKIFNYEVKGIGRGEILLSYLSDDISINGGKGDYDVNFNKTKMEVKEVNATKTHFKNFRLGVLSREHLQNAYNDIKYLYGVAKYHIPEINNKTFEAKVAKGELTTLIKPLKDFVPSNLGDVERVQIEVAKSGKMFYNGLDVGNVKESQKIIQEILDSAKVDFKTFAQIEQGLREKLGKKTMPYIFFGDNKGSETAKLFHVTSLENLEIDTITQGNIKIKIPR